MDLIGSSIGMLDHAYYLTRLSRNRPLFFKHGWGDVDRVTEEYQQVLYCVSDIQGLAMH
jgi:hypothetical protein